MSKNDSPWKQIVKCRACYNVGFETVIDLGSQYVVDFVQNKDAMAQRAPLELVRCRVCSLVQLKHSVNPDRLYKKFWYRSGISESMKLSLREVVGHALLASNYRINDRFLDIGCNDGTLLSMVPTKMKRVGVDPCRELVTEGLNDNCMEVGLAGYFSADLVQTGAPYKVITAISMFYDVEDPVKFLIDCKKVLDPEGVLVIQMNYLGTMLRDLAVDNICHEHLTYFSLAALENVVEASGLEVQGTQLNSVNGGSLRAFITHPGCNLRGFSMAKQTELHVAKLNLRKQEEDQGLENNAPYVLFNQRVTDTVTLLKKYLMEQARSAGKIYLYGASTRGSTLMQLLDLEPGIIRGAAERDPKKVGLMTVGTWIPIYEEAYCRKMATHFLVLPWHFWDAIRKREEKFLNDGGTMIIPLPHPRFERRGNTVPLSMAVEVGQ